MWFTSMYSLKSRRFPIATFTFILVASSNSRTDAFSQSSPSLGGEYPQDIPTLPHKVLSPPRDPQFPNGPCGGTLFTIPPSEIFPQNNFLNNLVLSPRPVQVWLPPNYSPSSDPFPVLYCHDGQNAVSDSSSWTGHSYRLTGALTRLFSQNRLRSIPIVVLLPSSRDDLLPLVRRRHLEYGDASVLFSQAHADFVATKIKPFIDHNLNTIPTPDGTSAIGTSLGGQASLHLLLRHPQSFGGAACLSPCFQPATILQTFRKSKSLKNKVLYIDNGGDVEDIKVPWFVLQDHFTVKHWWNPGFFWLDTHLQPGVDAMRWVLDNCGVRYEYYRVPGGRHNEREWSRRIDWPLLKLYA